jgi:hypothetical protein
MPTRSSKSGRSANTDRLKAAWNEMVVRWWLGMAARVPQILE